MMYIKSPNVRNFMNVFNTVLRILIWTSFFAYMAELSMGTDHSHEAGSIYFLYFERCVALIFTFEYLFRWYIGVKDRGTSIIEYPTSAMGMIDLIAIAPFWIGFLAHPSIAMIPVSLLAYIRAARCLRLMKLLRYNRSLQLTCLGFYTAFRQLKALSLALVIIGSFTAILIFEAERHNNQDFTLFNSFWFVMVTVTTVGYGDMSPVTIPGRLITMGFFFFALAIYGGILGTVGNAFVIILNQEEDESIDPVKGFAKEREKRRRIKAIESEYVNDF